jgi:hypothetical protein
MQIKDFIASNENSSPTAEKPVQNLTQTEKKSAQTKKAKIYL